MSLFLDNLWIWIVLTFIVGICGYVWFLHDPQRRTFIIAVVMTLLTLALGLTLYYGVDTDRKSIICTLNALIAAVEQDDYETVCQFLSPKADKVRQTAGQGMRMVNISRARYSKLEITINEATSPPSAHIAFTIHFYWQNKAPIEGMSVSQPVADIVRFEFEMVKTQSRSPEWQITNKFNFHSRFGFP